MEAHRITETFAMHGNEMTWEGHLAVVEHMSMWPVDEIVDFHETLIDHLVEGSWVRTSINRLITLEDGSQMTRGLKTWHDQIDEAVALEGSEPWWAHQRDMVDRAEAEPGDEVPPEIPDGLIGLPLHPWTSIPGQGRNLSAAAVRRALIAAINDQGSPELELLLRPAPWAYHRVTGAQLPGVVLADKEAQYAATQPRCLWARRLEISRGVDHVEAIQVYESWTGADLMPIAFEGLEKVVSARLRARMRVVGEPRRLGGERVPGLGLGDGQLVWAGPAGVGSTPPNELQRLLHEELSVSKKSATTLAPLPDAEFWNLLENLGSHRDDWDALIEALSRKSRAKIVSFQEALATKLHDLDLPELFEVADGEMPMSADVFLYVRCAVVAAGPSEYHRVLRQGSIRQDEWGEGESERLLSVASQAFSTRTGNDLDHETALSYETGSNPAWGDVENEGRPRFVGYSVRSVLAGNEEIRFWRTDEREVAVERQRAAVAGAVDEAGVFGLVDCATLPVRIALNGVSYIRAVSGTLEEQRLA